jgi:type III restriction enzyme
VTARQTTYEYIDQVPGVVGGDPKIKGTRVPIWAVVAYWRLYGTVSGVLAAYPHISREAVEEALAYYESHRKDIDRAIEENEAIANSPYADND